jgi:hypothetical protein
MENMEKMILIFILGLIGVLGIIYLRDARHKSDCHGQCGHDYKCYEMCAKSKDGCPHWNDYGGKDDRRN